jgi:hypothetical protein
MALLDEVAGHRRPHVAQPYEADGRHLPVSSTQSFLSPPSPSYQEQGPDAAGEGRDADPARAATLCSPCRRRLSGEAHRGR